MADENTIIEGTVKFRDGKKWKSRWCVMRKLSPVADCVQLQLYRSARRGGGGGGRGSCCAALSLQQFAGAEAGFTLDKQSNTLALVCRDLVAVLAFETRERLIQWQVKVTAALGSSRAHLVVVRGGALPSGPARLHLLDSRAALTAGAPPKLLGLWEIRHLRRYGVVEGRFCFEGGSLCGKGEGLHVLVSDRPQDIARDFELAARGRLSPKRRPLAPKTVIDRAESPSLESGGGAEWCGARAGAEAEAGAEDTASVRGVPAGGGPVALERCMSCMSKLGALSRSSTAPLTPGAKHFSPAWTMEAVSEPPAEQLAAPSPPPPPPAPPSRPARPERLDLPRACFCEDTLLEGELSGIGPYENYDVPRVPSNEIEGEYYDTPKRLRECVESELFRITNSSTANTLILKKPCGCLLRFGRKRREPTVVDTDEDFQPQSCPCQRVTDWANNWIKLPYCKRNTASSEPLTFDKENVTPDASALYATIDFSRKTRRKTCGDHPVEVDTGPLAHYENLNFALSLEYYENAKDMLRKAGVTQTELNAISANLKPVSFTTSPPRRTCKKCGRLPKGLLRTEANDEYLMMEPKVIENCKFEQSKIPPSGYTPMSPIGGFAFHTLKHPTKSPIRRLLEEKSASNPSLCGAGGARGAGEARGGGGRPRSSSADSSRFLDDVKEFEGSVGGSGSSLETLRDVTADNHAPDGKSSDVDSSEASKGRETKTRSPKTVAVNGNRDSSSSNDSGVSSWSLRPAPAEYELPRCTAAGRRHWRASRRPPAPRAPRSPRAPRHRSSDAPRTSPPPEPPKSSSAEAEVPLLSVHSLRGATDSRSTSSGASDMSDYIETLSLCSSHSSSDAPVTMRARVTSTLRPRSGKEYARVAPPRAPAPPPPAPPPAPR